MIPALLPRTGTRNWDWRADKNSPMPSLLQSSRPPVDPASQPGSTVVIGRGPDGLTAPDEHKVMELRRNPPIFMTLQEAADFLQVSKDTVRRWAKAGRIRQYNRGTRNPLFASAELIQSIKEAC